MKLFKVQFIFLFISILIASCSGSDDSNSIDTGSENILATITTDQVSNITGTSATIGGTVTNEGSGQADFRGICWSTNINPTLDNDYESINSVGLGSFNVTINNLQPNTTYNARAFVQNSAGIAYGSNVVFITNEVLEFTTDIPRHIITTRVTLKTTIADPGEGVFISERGFVLNTSPNPTIDHIALEEGGSGFGEFFGQVTHLNINTNYYVRAYARTGFGYSYGEEYMFKTTGYFGPAGGYVVYDKGEMTDGWRYYEAAPTTSSFTSKWGCDGTFISNTFPEFGEGFDNTQVILANCSDSNCAARKCANYSFGGLNDWFLPSREGMVATMRSLKDLNALPTSNEIWTSTQITGTNAYTANYNGNDDAIYTSSDDKGFTYTVIPVRRYQ